MREVKLKLIAAACENMGIGINGTLPWRLKQEMLYFTEMTTRTQDNEKRNAVIMGRRTWDCIPDKFRPLSARINIVLTRQVEKLKEKVPDGVVVLANIDEALSYIKSNSNIESAWVIGGNSIYKAAMEHQACDKIYLTEIQKHFDCDTFFPKIDSNQFSLVENHSGEDSCVPFEKQCEGDITYYYRIYKRK